MVISNTLLCYVIVDEMPATATVAVHVFASTVIARRVSFTPLQQLLGNTNKSDYRNLFILLEISIVGDTEQ